MITKQQIIEILDKREENIDGGETLGIHCINYGKVADAILKAIDESPLTPSPDVEKTPDEFIQKHLAKIWESVKDASIAAHIKPMFGSLDAASIEYFLKTQTVNGGFRQALHAMMDQVKNWKSSPAPQEAEGVEQDAVDKENLKAFWRGCE